MNRDPYFGLDKSTFKKVIGTIESFSDVIDVCYIFGSRTRDDYKKSSDIDIAIRFRQGMSTHITRIMSAFDALSIIYSVDVIDYDKVNSINLRTEIERDGVVVYDSRQKGGKSVDQNRLTMKYNDLEKAMSKLDEVLERDHKSDSIVIDATIQRFEFTFELCWKLMKSLLEYDGFDNVSSPRKAIRESFKQGYIDEGSEWIDMLEDRNRTSHTYDEATALEIYSHIKSSYAKLLSNYVSTAKKLISEI